jgi:phage terminase small subunit|tara:strand:+ start:1639 stop:2148 length:510 start_codon:yes stop_codon:yes gene_type:complete
MPKKSNQLKTTSELTQQQRKFVDILVANWGNIKKVDAAEQAGYKSTKGKPYEIASRLLNPDLNPHVCRYLEKRLEKERAAYESDKLKRYKVFERLRDGAESRGQYTGAINAEFRAGQMAGHFIDKKEITHNTLEGMTRDQLENRLKELERKIGESEAIIDVSPKKEKLK